MKRGKQFEIDLVYLWVDGNDPAWLEKKLKTTGEFAPESETNCQARYIDNEELRYSLRSAEQFAPWIRKIFIVTDNQKPLWLDTSNPRVEIIDHTQILPPEARPCFNSAVIEYFLYRIQGLSEHFLYANDDMFFGAPVGPEFFFDPEDGYPIVRMTRKRFCKVRWVVKQLLKAGVGYYRTSVHTAALLTEKYTGKLISAVPHHNIDAYLRSDYKKAVEEVFNDTIEASLSHHVRADGDLQRSAFSFYPIAIGHAHLRNARHKDSKRIQLQHHNFMNIFKRSNSMLFCINDTQDATDEDRARVKPFLEELFPEKSEFETTS